MQTEYEAWTSEAVKQSSGALCHHAKYGKTHGPNRPSQGQAGEAEFSSWSWLVISLISLHYLAVVIADSTATGLEKREGDIQRGWWERERDTQTHMGLPWEREKREMERDIYNTPPSPQKQILTQRECYHTDIQRHTQWCTQMYSNITTHWRKHKHRKTGSRDKFKQQTRPDNISQNTVLTIRHGWNYKLLGGIWLMAFTVRTTCSVFSGAKIFS